MAGESRLPVLLAGLRPEARAGHFVVVSGVAAPPEWEAAIQEDEGLTYVVRQEVADAAGLTYDFVAAWITLRVHSALAAVGLTAAVSVALAEAGISCNVLAAFHHDHLLVPADRCEDAIQVLEALATDAAG